MTEYKKSVVSGAELQPLFNLGKLHVSNFLVDGENPTTEPCDLELAFDPVSKVVQLTKQPELSELWGSMYWYRSAVNPAMKSALKNLAEATVSCTPLPSKHNSIYLDIASNDGTLLFYVDKRKFYRIGIDPSDYPEAVDNSECVIRDYFSATNYWKFAMVRAARISCAAMFYDLNDPIVFLNNVYEVLEDDGVFVLQLSYTPLMLTELEFGNICHEHLCYYNLTSLKYLFDNTCFKIKDVELNDVNGGSIRVFLQKDIAPDNFKTPAERHVAAIRIQSLLDWEAIKGYNDTWRYMEFFEKVKALKEETVSFIKDVKSQGKIVWGYGASTKGNSLLQFFGLDNTLIDGIAEKQECKFGRRTIGTNIPIHSEEEFRKANPDYCLILPWFFAKNFIEREKNYLDNGGKFILPAPKFSLFP